MDYDHDAMEWRGGESGDRIAVGSMVRLRVLNEAKSARQLAVIGTIADPFLGVIGGDDE